MTSNLDFRRYQTACIEFLGYVEKRPGMYVNTLEELHVLIVGHEMAFFQLGYIDESQGFSQDFVTWLQKRTSFSFEAGWCEYIHEHAQALKESDYCMFFQLFHEFLRDWRIE
jgi:hypothetical protein